MSTLHDCLKGTDGTNWHYVPSDSTKGFAVDPKPSTSGGLATAGIIGANNENATVVKASAGQIYSIQAFNIAATVVYLKLYNKATAPSEADTPVKRLAIPGATTGDGFIIHFPHGLAFSAGISYRVVTGIADADDTAPTASQQLINIDYK